MKVDFQWFFPKDMMKLRRNRDGGERKKKFVKYCRGVNCNILCQILESLHGNSVLVDGAD